VSQGAGAAVMVARSRSGSYPVQTMTPMTRRSAMRMLCTMGCTWVAAAAAPILALERRIKPDRTCALIIVDVQNCFIKGGTLAVKHGEDIVPVINRIAPAFANVVLTQDWHPPGHTSFASSHPGRKPYQTITLGYGTQVLWPDHCIQGTADAALDADLHVPQAQLILRKGFHKAIDSYSAFMEADHESPTGLEAYLKQRAIRTVFVVGLATDFCVAWTALDAQAAGFESYVIEDACRGIDLNGSLAAAWKEMARHGVKRIQSTDLDTA
jgi:nicotinamidase/pyrazinamidase